MKIILSIFLLFSLNCFAESQFYDFTAKDAKSNNKKTEEIYNRVNYNECRSPVYKAIKLASKRGHSYIHIVLDRCNGLNPEKLENELKSKGFEIKRTHTGIRGVNFVDVMTIAW
jgi:hypothetical protein